MAETTSQLQAKLKALTDGKVDIMIDANNFKSTIQILREMSAEWENMTDVEQAAALELMGGKRQANVLSAILSNFDIVEEALETSLNSEGSALKENEKVLESIEGRVTLFKNSVQRFWQGLVDDSVIKTFVDLGRTIVELASQFGELESVLFIILMYFNMSKKYPFDLASMIFGPNGMNFILKGLGKIRSALQGLTKFLGGFTKFFAGFTKTKQTMSGALVPQTPLNQTTQQTGTTTSSSTPITPGLLTSEKEQTSFFTNMINNARMAAQNIWQLFINMINKLKAAASNIFTGAFNTVKNKLGSFANQIKKAYYKATNQAFVVNETGKVSKAEISDRRMTVYNDKTDSDAKTASRVSQIWQNHMARLRDSIGRVRQDFSTLWQHHNERVAQSVKYASTQFNKLKTAASNTFGKISAVTSNVASGIRNAYGKASDYVKTQAFSIRNAFVKATSRAYATDETGKVHRATVSDRRMTVYQGQTGSDTNTASKVSQMWQNHIGRLRDSIGRVKQDFSTVWQHHNERVAQSVKYASAQFNKLKTAASNAFGKISSVASSVANGMKGAYGKATDYVKAQAFSIRNAFVKATSKAYAIDETGKVHRAKILPTTLPAVSEPQEQSYSKINEAINKIRTNLYNTVENGKVMFQNLAANIGKQFNNIKNSIGNAVGTTFNNIKNGVATGFNNTVNSVSAAFNKIKSKFSKQSSTSLIPTADAKGYQKTYSKFASTAKKVSAEIGRIWNQHTLNVNRSFQAVQNTFSRVWANHKLRVADSVAYAKSQFATMANGVSSAFTAMQTKIYTGFSWITSAIQTVATKINTTFSKIFAPLVAGFKNAVAKIKGFAGDFAKVFKTKLGYQQTVATGPSMFDSLSRIQGKKVSMYDGGMTEQSTAQIIDTANKKAAQGQGVFQKYITTMQGGNDALRAYLASLNGGKATMAGYNKFLQEHNAGVKASGLAATAAGIAHTFLNAALSMGISLILSGIISAVSSWMNKNKELAESVEEVMSKYESMNQELKDHYDTIEEIKEDYAELANGVDNLGRNISLSTEEYKRYNEIVNQIAEMFPDMVTGYTEEGNAIIALKGNVEELTAAYEEAAKAARDELLIKQNDIYTNFTNNTTGYNHWTGTSKQGELDILEQLIAGGDIEDFMSRYVQGEYVDGLIEREIDTILENAGITETNWFWSADGYQSAIEQNMPSIIARARELRRELEEESKAMTDVIYAYLQNNSTDYAKLTDEGKSMAQAIISGFDTEFYSAKAKELGSIEKIESWIVDNVVLPLQDAGNLDKFQLAFDLQTKFNGGDVTVDQYIKETNEFLELLNTLGFDEEIVKQIRVFFDVDDYETKRESAKGILDDAGDTKAGTLSKQELDIIDKNKDKWQEEMKVEKKTVMSWDELKKKIAEAKIAAIDSAAEWEKASEAIDSVQDAYSTLTDVVKQYNSNGYLTLDNLQALLELGPEYLSVLQMENGQLSLNQQAMEALLNTQLAKAEATVVDNAITQLNTLAEQAKAAAVEGSTGAMSNAIPTLDSYASSLSQVGQEALIATGKLNLLAEATNGAVAAGVDSEAIKSVYRGIEAQFGLINKTRSSISTNFNKIVSPDSSSSDKGDSALEQVQKQYEGKIKNLENQQTYIENEIEKLEAQEEGVSADYYEKQIDLEEEKIALYEQEREELLKLERTDEVADAIWEVEHAIQESTLRMIEFRKSISELYATASENITEAYDRRQQLSDDKTSFIENEISIRETKGELIPTSAYDELIAEARYKKANAEEELNAQADLYWQGIEQNGEAWGSSDEAIDILEKIRQKKLDMQEASKQEAEYIEQQKDAYIAYYDKMMEAYDHRNNFLQSQSDYAQSYIDRLGVLNINVPDEAYKKVAAIQELSAAGLREQLEFANSELAKFEEQGIDKNDPRYIEKFNEALALEQQIYEKETEVYETHQQIFDNQIDRFNQVIDRINDATQNLQNISGLLEREDVATEDGEWTAEGLTRLGLAYQQMEYYKQSSDEIVKKMAEVKRQYQNNEITEKTYYETMRALSDQQWENIDGYENMKDAIIEANEARIDMIEEGLDKEIEAYQELIDIKKEALDAERDLYEFKKDVEKQTKDIAALERRIASMSGSTDASTIAERTKLEAQLREAKASLNDTYYDHAMDSQSNALDDELEAFTKNSENYIESLRESIKDVDLLIETTFTDVMQNGEIVLQTLTNLSNEYGFQLDGYLTAPWKNATGEALNFETYATQHFNAVYGAVETKTTTLTEYTKAPWKAGEDQAKIFNEESNKYMDGVVSHAETEYKTQLQEKLNYPWEQANGYTSWGTGIKDVLDQAVLDAQEAGRKIAAALNVAPPDITGSGDTTGGDGEKYVPSPTKPTVPTKKQMEKTATLGQEFSDYFGQSPYNKLNSGPITIDGVQYYKRNMQDRNGNSYTYYYKWSDSSKVNTNGRGGMITFPKGTAVYKKNYAKGTMGTTKDQWAYTDEPWLGDELVLVPTAQGNLSYMRKGTSVVPAAITENLVEWGKLDPTMMSIGDMSGGIQMMSNYVSKPELNISFDSLVHVDHCDEGTLKDLEKMVDTKINQFSKQMNYAIKKFK